MTEINALIGRVQFDRLPEFISRRRELAEIYINELAEFNGIKLIVPKNLKSSSFWKVPALLNSNLSRPRVTKFLSENGITIDWAYQPALHMQPVMQNLYNSYKGQLPITEDCLSRNINLPCHPRLTNEDVVFTCNKLKEIILNERKNL